MLNIFKASALRARSPSGKALIAFLERGTSQFDGHKGQPLGFRPWDHQLRQPLYVVTDASKPGVIEVPRGGPPNETSVARLDRLGVGAAESACRMAP